MKRLLDQIRRVVRGVMRRVAGLLNSASGSKLHPDTVTIFGFLMHVPIAVLIATGRHNILAALLLIIFGLFDTLDGELARLQKRESDRGGLLDASTDRMKEVLLYSGAAYVLALGAHPAVAAWAVAACGASLCVSYVKSKGETIMATRTSKASYAKLNHIFKDGLLTFELRMAILVIGLLVNRLAVVVIIIAVLASYTALQRLVRISNALT